MIDLATFNVSKLGFSTTATGRDIAVLPGQRQIYVLSPDSYDAYLTVMDMDTGAVLLATDIGGSSIVVDEAAQMIFTANQGLSPATLYRYAIIKDENGQLQLQLMQSLRTGSNGRKINISPDGKHVVLPCGGGNGPGYTLYDFDATDFETVFDEWDIGTYPKVAAFSPDGTILYGSNGSAYDNFLYVMDAQTYEQIHKLPFPNADNYAVFTPNSDGTVVVGFSYDTYNDSQFQFYFFTDVSY